VVGLHKVPQGPCAPTTACPQGPLWLRLLRSTFVTAGKIGLAFFLLGLVGFGPLPLSYAQAQRAHNTVQTSGEHTPLGALPRCSRCRGGDGMDSVFAVCSFRGRAYEPHEQADS